MPGDPAETLHPFQIYQVLVVREPKLHGKQQFRAAAVGSGLIAQFAQETGRLLDRTGAVDGERRQLHALARSGMRSVFQCLVWPPSATIIAPVTQLASSEARKATAGAISAGIARRGMACNDTTKSKASACGPASTPSLAVSPGATAFTAMP